MSRWLIKYFFIRTMVASIFLSIGCGLSVNISDLSKLPESQKMSKGIAPEFVSGSEQHQRTLIRRYEVMHSTGNMTSEIVSKSFRGYRMYSSVQGVVISKEISP